MVEHNSNSLLPHHKGPTKEQLKKNLQKIIKDTHAFHKGKPGQYRINFLHAGPFADMFTKKELEEMGLTVRDMPVIKEEQNG